MREVRWWRRPVAGCPRACGCWGTVWPRRSMGSRPGSLGLPGRLFTGTIGSTIVSSPQPRASGRWWSSTGSSCGRGRGAYDVATFISEAFPPQRRREEELGLLGEYHAILEGNGVRGYTFEECLDDYRFSMLEILVFWIITGGYRNYEGERAAAYLRNTLERLDAAVSDLAPI